MKTLSEQIRSVDEYNQLVPLALGLLSASRRLDAVLEASLAADAPRDEAVPGDDPVLLAALGVVALRARLGRWLEHAAPDSTSDRDPAPAEAEPVRSELLR